MKKSKKSTQNPKSKTGRKEGNRKASSKAEKRRDEDKRQTFWVFIFLIMLSLFLTSFVVYWTIAPTEATRDDDAAVIANQTRKKTRESVLPVLDRIFPDKVLDDAWESYPLLVTSTPPSGVCTAADDDKERNQTTCKPSNTIPTHTIPPPQQQNRKNFFRSIFQITDLDEVLSDNKHLTHGTDFQIVKKTLRNGEEWMGMLPMTHMSSNDAKGYVFRGGFSLVLNKLQTRWRAVAELSRSLQKETYCHHVSCNLYLTPRVVDLPVKQGQAMEYRSAFEVHYDWMDVIVLQVSGSKLWNVARSPLVKYTTKDLKRKPNLEEVDAFLREDSFDRFLLRPGDALYIPRGFLHNASTVLGEGEEHSLHLSFGIEHLCQTTYEVLMHGALYLYSQQSPAMHHALLTDEQCNALYGNPQQGLNWQAFFHFLIGEVARSDVLNPSSPHRAVKEWVSKVSALRKSVPLHPVWKNEIQPLKNTAIYETYHMCLTALLHLGNGKDTSNFISLLQEYEEMQQSFCFPMGLELMTHCTNWDGYVSESKVQHLLHKFVNFAMHRSVFDEAFALLEGFRETAAQHDWREEDVKLQLVGQSIN